MNVQRYARVAGVLLLISMVAGGLGEAYIPSKIIGPDAFTTAANLKSHELLFRLGFATFMIESLCDITLVLILYALLRPVNKQLSLLAAFFGLMGTALFAFAELFYFAPPLILGGAPYLKTFSTDQLNTLAMLSLKFYGYAGMIFTAYYGMGWIVRGFLMFRSGYLPKFLGILMAMGGAGFVVRNFAMILAPAYASDIFLMLMFPGGLILTVWLLIKGVNVPKWQAKLNASEAAAA
ncbi:MAG TPA: DUF4386 domain-containing protein [Pyrinomonadaceae bacterium]|nr:DUF4386 domain-containing protein [Pyrinomonadaceae bacterium]